MERKVLKISRLEKDTSVKVEDMPHIIEVADRKYLISGYPEDAGSYEIVRKTVTQLLGLLVEPYKHFPKSVKITF